MRIPALHPHIRHEPVHHVILEHNAVHHLHHLPVKRDPYRLPGVAGGIVSVIIDGKYHTAIRPLVVEILVHNRLESLEGIYLRFSHLSDRTEGFFIVLIIIERR